MEVSIRELKNHLSQYIHRIQKGEGIIITSHHKPVARLTPILQSKNEVLQALLQTEGFHWNGKKPQGSKTPPKLKGNTASDSVLEDRR